MCTAHGSPPTPTYGCILFHIVGGSYVSAPWLTPQKTELVIYGSIFVFLGRITTCMYGPLFTMFRHDLTFHFLPDIGHWCFCNVFNSAETNVAGECLQLFLQQKINLQ